MSVEQLVLKTDRDKIEINKLREGFSLQMIIAYKFNARINLDHNQANLLMLYLQEHLK